MHGQETEPFAPGAGTRPPELTGRDDIIENATIAPAPVKAGRWAKCQMLLGLRGVGKTVLLNEIARIAEFEGYRAIALELRLLCRRVGGASRTRAARW